MFCLVTDLSTGRTIAPPSSALFIMAVGRGRRRAAGGQGRPLRGAAPARGRASAPVPRTWWLMNSPPAASTWLARGGPPRAPTLRRGPAVKVAAPGSRVRPRYLCLRPRRPGGRSLSPPSDRLLQDCGQRIGQTEHPRPDPAPKTRPQFQVPLVFAHAGPLWHRPRIARAVSTMATPPPGSTNIAPARTMTPPGCGPRPAAGSDTPSPHAARRKLTHSTQKLRDQAASPGNLPS